ncbi:MAG: ATP-binding protein [Ginsengibacter sp.]
MNRLKKIVAIGPESTGKSTLCSQLATHYHTKWVPEYARKFLEVNADYKYDDLLTIAKGQIQLEEVITNSFEVAARSGDKSRLDGSNKNNLLFIDTDMYVMQVWCEFVYNRCHNWILSQIATRKYDGYLLCNIDLPWEQDGMREYPDRKVREKLFHFYRELMINQNVPWIEISGDHDERLQNAIQFVDKL